MNRFSALTEIQRLRWSFAASVVVTALCLSLLGLMLRPRLTPAPPEPHQPFLVAIRLAPQPLPKPQSPVKARPPVRRIRPRLVARHATLRAASAQRTRRATPHPTPSLASGGSPSFAPAPATPPVPVKNASPAHSRLVLIPHSPLSLSLSPSASFGAPKIPAPTAGSDSGAAAGQGTGGGTGTGTGAGGGQGTSSGSGNPFGVGSGGTGTGEGQRHIVYVLDISGSMISRIDRARQELRDALAGLQPGESFDIITFSTEVHPFSESMNPATPTLISRADFFLSTLQVVGGTNLEGALQQALQTPGVNVVFVITDGVPTIDAHGDGIDDTKKYMADFPRRVRAWNINNARIYTVGLVGKDPDGRDESFEAAGMLQQISHDSGGVSKIVTVGVATPQ